MSAAQANLPLWWKFWLLGPQAERLAAAACLESLLTPRPAPDRRVLRKQDDRLAAFEGSALSLQINQNFEADIQPPFDEGAVRAALAQNCPRVAVVLAHQSSALFQGDYLTRTTTVWIWRPAAMPAWPTHQFFVGVSFTGIVQVSMETPSLSFGDVVHCKERGVPEVQVAESLCKLEPVCHVLRTYLLAIHRSDSLFTTLPTPPLNVVPVERL